MDLMTELIQTRRQMKRLGVFQFVLLTYCKQLRDNVIVYCPTQFDKQLGPNKFPHTSTFQRTPWCCRKRCSLWSFTGTYRIVSTGGSHTTSYVRSPDVTHREKRIVCQCGWKQRFAPNQTDPESIQSVQSAHKAEGREPVTVAPTVTATHRDFITL